MLKAENISYSIDGKYLLKDISATFEPGKLHLIIGPNGAGKSTFLKVISHQLQPQKGSVLYDDQNIRHLTVSSLARRRAVLSQNIDLAFPLTVTEVVMMGRYPHFNQKPARTDYEAITEAMEFFDVIDLADRNYMTLSGGEKQRVHFARVSAQIWFPNVEQSRYLILDEPLTFLDVHYQFDFMEKVLKLLRQTGLVVIGVVHDLNLAARFADQIILLNQGRMLASGSTASVLTKENIQRAYHLEPVIHRKDGKMYLFF